MLEKARSELNRRQKALTEISKAIESEGIDSLQKVLDDYKETKLPSQEFEKVRKELAQRKQRATAPVESCGTRTFEPPERALAPQAVEHALAQAVEQVPASQAPVSSPTPATNGLALLDADDDDDDIAGL